jgi:hypothetical protein
MAGAGADASVGVAAASVDLEADEQAPSTMAEHASADEKDFTITPWKEEAGIGQSSLPRRFLHQQDRF